LEYYDLVASFPQFGTETNTVSWYLLRYFYSDMYGAPEGTQLLFKLKEHLEPPYD
jgi:hypothetical protein